MKKFLIAIFISLFVFPAFVKAEDNSNADDLVAKGMRYILSGEYGKAIELYTSAIALNPNDAFNYNRRGIVYDIAGQYDKAIKDYSKAIELDPNNADFYFNRGNTYVKTKQYDKAIDDFNKVCATGDKTSCEKLEIIKSKLGQAGKKNKKEPTASKDQQQKTPNFNGVIKVK
jgi:tetratricopeptide (TPR) repeat protein